MKGIDYTYTTAQGRMHPEPVIDGDNPAPQPRHPSQSWEYDLGWSSGCWFTPLFFQTNLLVL